MTFCGEASSWAKIALLVTVLALVMHATGYGTNYWMVRYTVRDQSNFGIGLWRMTNCSGYYGAPCTDSGFPDEYTANYVTVTKAVTSCALIFLTIAAICLTFYIGAQRSRVRGMSVAILALAFLTVALLVVGAVVWIVNLPASHYPGWSLGLTLFAATLSTTAGVLMIPDIREYDYKDVLKVGGHGGEFKNMAGPDQEYSYKAEPAPENLKEDAEATAPDIVIQNYRTAPKHEFLSYNRAKIRDGF